MQDASANTLVCAGCIGNGTVQVARNRRRGSSPRRHSGLAWEGGAHPLPLLPMPDLIDDDGTPA